MTARDRWTIEIACCGNAGTAKVSQNDGWAFKNDPTTRVDAVPDGFKTEYVMDGDDPIICEKCGKKVW